MYGEDGGRVRCRQGTGEEYEAALCGSALSIGARAHIPAVVVWIGLVRLVGRQTRSRAE